MGGRAAALGSPQAAEETVSTSECSQLNGLGRVPFCKEPDLTGAREPGGIIVQTGAVSTQ